MGMFDRIWFDCPSCGERIEVQSKGGSCTLQSYERDAVPIASAGYVLGHIVDCGSCKTKFRVAGCQRVELRLLKYRGADDDSLID